MCMLWHDYTCPALLSNAGSTEKQHQFLALSSRTRTGAPLWVQLPARRIAGTTERRMDAALLGGREGVWQPCAPSCSGRNGSAAPSQCHNLRRRQWVVAPQPSTFRSPFATAPALLTCCCHLHTTSRLSKRPCTEQPLQCANAGDERCVWPLRAQKHGSSQRITSTGARPSWTPHYCLLQYRIICLNMKLHRSTGARVLMLLTCSWRWTTIKLEVQHAPCSTRQRALTHGRPVQESQ